MATLEQNVDTKLMTIIKKATDFHGHLGPFLVIGVRMGLIGIRELAAKMSNERLRVTAMTKRSVPFSCVIDGIQVTTKCTMGNRQLRLRNSSNIAAKFELQNGKQVTVRVNQATLDRLKNSLLAKEVSSEELQRLAMDIASLSEEELFIKKG